MKKPDVFDTVVNKYKFDPNGSHIGHEVVTSEQAVTLLRRHHARVRKLVTKMYPSYDYTEADEIKSKTLNEVLTALDKLAGKKGTR